MRNYIQKWKTVNKNALNLSFVCGLNWLFRFVVKAHYHFFSGVLVVLITNFLSHDLRQMAVYTYMILLLVNCLEKFCHVALSSDPMKLKIFFQSVTTVVFFIAGSSYVYQDHFSELVLIRLILLCLMNLVGGQLVDLFQLKLFESYLFQKVIDKEYLGIGKTVEDLPPESSLHVDVEERDADKRMKMINKNVVKQDYQEIVEVNFLNREVQTGISCKVVSDEQDIERIFQDMNVVYHLVFAVYPFGIGIKDFDYTLIELKFN